MRDMQAQLEKTNLDLVMRNQEIQFFYHTLSHELKTPLTSAHEFVSIVMDGLAGEVNETQLSYLRIAKESCMQLAVYINDLLDATRLETGKLHVELHPASVEAVIQRAITMIQPAAAAKKIHLSAELDANLPDAVVDKSRILQILTNLLNNAVKFTPEGGSIVVKLALDPIRSEARISVTDTGCGIPTDQVEHIFDRLYQVKAGDTTSKGGIGLGLYLCRELVLLHGGKIWVESELGKGSIFSFVIPLRAPPKGAHVLIVDDEYDIRETLRLALEDQNFQVTTAEGGSEALQRMRENVPDLVVLDLRMAGLDGTSTLKQIRLNWGLIPVIVYTGFPDSELLRQGLECSPITLLAKPCPMKRFVETVQRLCRPKETGFLSKNAKHHPVLTVPSV